MTGDLDVRHLPDEYELPKARLKIFALLAVSALLVVGGLLLNQREPMTSVLVSAFFSLCVLVFVMALFGGSRVVLEREGFEVRNLFRPKRYAWRDVSEFTHARVGRTRMILFNDTTRPDTAHGMLRRFLRGYNSGFPAGMLAGPLDRVCERMNAFRARALRKA